MCPFCCNFVLLNYIHLQQMGCAPFVATFSAEFNKVTTEGVCPFCCNSVLLNQIELQQTDCVPFVVTFPPHRLKECHGLG